MEPLFCRNIGGKSKKYSLDDPVNHTLYLAVKAREFVYTMHNNENTLNE